MASGDNYYFCLLLQRLVVYLTIYIAVLFVQQSRVYEITVFLFTYNSNSECNVLVSPAQKIEGRMRVRV